MRYGCNILPTTILPAFNPSIATWLPGKMGCATLPEERIEARCAVLGTNEGFATYQSVCCNGVHRLQEPK